MESEERRREQEADSDQPTLPRKKGGRWETRKYLMQSCKLQQYPLNCLDNDYTWPFHRLKLATEVAQDSRKHHIFTSFMLVGSIMQHLMVHGLCK